MDWTSEKDQLLRGSMHCCRGERARMPNAMDCYVIISYAQKEHWQGRYILRTAFMLHFSLVLLIPWIILRNKSRRIPSILFSLSLSPSKKYYICRSRHAAFGAHFLFDLRAPTMQLASRGFNGFAVVARSTNELHRMLAVTGDRQLIPFPPLSLSPCF